MRSLRTQLALVMLATVLVPLGLVAILSWQLLEAASSLGFYREVEEALRLGAEEARERHRAELAAVRAALHAAERQALADPNFRADCAALAQDIVSLGLQATCESTTQPPSDPWLGDFVRAATSRPEVLERTERGRPYGRLSFGDRCLVVTASESRSAGESFDRLHAAEQTYAHLARVRPRLSARFLWMYLALAAALSAIAIMAGRGLASRVLDPVDRLIDGVRRIGKGELRPELGPRPSGELGQLMESIQLMASELDQSRDRLVFLDKVAHWQEAAKRLAHQIQNPLTPIQLICQELRAKHAAGDPQFAKLLDSSVQIIEEEVASLRRLVESFSTFARLPEPRLAQVELMSILRSFVDSRRSQHPGVLIELSGPLSLELVADADLIRQVVRNLLDNSVEAMSGVGRVLFSVEPPELARSPNLVISDTGPGIPFALRERLFDPYVSSKSRGSGLGLAIARKILWDHGWEIALLDSREGAVFAIRLGPSPPGSPHP